MGAARHLQRVRRRGCPDADIARLRDAHPFVGRVARRTEHQRILLDRFDADKVPRASNLIEEPDPLGLRAASVSLDP